MQQQNPIEKQLQAMVNRTFAYGQRILEIRGYQIEVEKDKVWIHTNEKEFHYERPLTGIHGFLKEFKPTELMAVKHDASFSDMLMSKARGLGDQLQGIIMDNIEKVQVNREYIPQATAINNNINSLINLTKLQMDMLKTAQKHRPKD